MRKSFKSYMMSGLKSRHKVMWTLKSLLALGIGVIVLIPPNAFAAEKEPTTITSKTMIANNKARTVIFQGEVIFTRGDLVVHSDEMIIRFKTDEKSQTSRAKSPDQTDGQKIDVVEAIGNVVIEKTKGRATCGRAMYYTDEDKIVLTESPVAWQEGTRVTGPKMTMYLEEGRSVVEGGTHVVIEEKEGI